MTKLSLPASQETSEDTDAFSECSVMRIGWRLLAGFLGPVGLLRFIDSFATGNVTEHHRGVGQFAERRRVLLFRPRRKTATHDSVKLAVSRFHHRRCHGAPHDSHNGLIDLTDRDIIH